MLGNCGELGIISLDRIVQLFIVDIAVVVVLEEEISDATFFLQ